MDIISLHLTVFQLPQRLTHQKNDFIVKILKN